jgi:peptidoglycan/LPS O-acetylase OafA/YrhL
MTKAEAAPIVLATTFAICILSWHFFEKPILRLKRYFWNAPLDRPRTAAPVPEDDGGRAPKPANAY